MQKKNENNWVIPPASKSFPMTKEEEDDLKKLNERPGIRVISYARREP